MSKPTSRDLLRGLGITDHNATTIIPYMMIAPATTDPKAGQIIMLVRAIQRILFNLGATDIQNTGELDPATARALRMVTGEGWERASWGANARAVLSARDLNMHLTPTPSAAPVNGVPVAVSGPLDFLPDVPGGLVTYAIVGYLVYRHIKKRRAA
jgi:hypothetical protein